MRVQLSLPLNNFGHFADDNTAVVAGFAFVFECNRAVFQCKNGMVFAESGVPTRNNFRAALAHNNISNTRRLATIEFRA
ncbi:MAG: hypothetical protein G01um101417_14 [Parcubacteria group bacterium Gr01-1014_17]|nr:MAG: hypothetical protein G01um101417_14 [Parcubacteria group bacterium Gr01-1014_17]